jgi:hypothetical protein
MESSSSSIVVPTKRPQVPTCILQGPHCVNNLENQFFAQYSTKFISDQELTNWEKYREKLPETNFLILREKCGDTKPLSSTLPDKCLGGTPYLMSNKIMLLEDYMNKKDINEEILLSWYEQGKGILKQLHDANLILGNIRPNSLMVDITNVETSPKLKFANLSKMFEKNTNNVPVLTDTLLPAFYRVWVQEDTASIKLQYNGKYNPTIDYLETFRRENPSDYLTWMRRKLIQLDDYAFFNALATLASDKVILSPTSPLVKEQETQYHMEGDLPAVVDG